MDYGKICAFTGYEKRELIESIKRSSAEIDDIKNMIKEIILDKVNEGFLIFQCGMSLGSDFIFADKIIEIRNDNPLLQIYLIIPCMNQELNWNPADKERYYELLNLADKVIYTSDQYYDGCIDEQNRYLVDNSDELIAIYDGTKGSSSFAINYAEIKRKKITVIDPSTLVKVTLYN